MARYQRKTETVEAEQYATHRVAPSLLVDPETDQLRGDVHWAYDRLGRISILGTKENESVLVFPFEEGEMFAYPGDYVIKVGENEFLPMNAAAFETTYQLA